MNVLILSPGIYPDPGGVQTYTHQLASALVEQGFRVEVAAPVFYPGGEPERLYYFSGTPGGSQFSAGLHFLKKLVKKRELDIIIALTWRVAVPCALFNMFKNVPYIVCAHGTELDAKRSRNLGQVKKLVFDRAAAVTANSNFTAKQVPYGKRVTVINPGINLPAEIYLPDYKEKEDKNKSSPVLLTVGRLVSRKGVDSVIEAVKDGLEIWPGLTYWIVGDGRERENLSNLVREYSLESHVKFWGQLDNNQLKEIYKKADIFIMTSRMEQGKYEGFGLAFLEANACGLPVIGSEIGGIPDAVKDGESGLLVKPDNPKEIANAVYKIYEEKVLPPGGPVRWARKFDWTEVGREWAMFIQETVHGN